MEHRVDQNRQKMALNGDGIAEMMGALLLTAVITISIGILAVIVFSGFSSVETPALRVGLINEEGYIDLIHRGGDTLYRDTTQIKVDGVDRTNDFETPQGDAWSTFSVGDHLISSVPYAYGTEILIIYTGFENPTVIETLLCQPGILPPVADFTYTPTSGYEPMVVSFEDLSSGDPTSWYWDFGDGTNSIEPNPVHTYSSSGLYEITLTVCNEGGCSSITKYIMVFGFSDFVVNESVFVYGSYLEIYGGNHVTGIDSTVIILDDFGSGGGVYLSVTNVYINGSVDLGGSATLGSETTPGLIYITGDLNLAGAPNVYGDTYVEGNVILGSSSYIHGDLYTNGNLNFNKGDLYGETHVNGDFSITNTGNIHENIYVDGDLTLDQIPSIDSGKYIYYTGSLIDYPGWAHQFILEKCIPVSSVTQFTMPEFIDMPIPSAKPDVFYTSRGYVSGGALTSGVKIFAYNSYSSSNWVPTAENVIIVAKSGDISISSVGGWVNQPSSGSGLTGVLFAPNGKVTFNGGHFEGLVIAKNGFYLENGGTVVVFKNMDQYISDPDDYPF